MMPKDREKPYRSVDVKMFYLNALNTESTKSINVNNVVNN